MAYRFRDELVFFDDIANSDNSLFYAPTLGICIVGTKEIITQMKSSLQHKLTFPEFEKMLETAWKTRTSIFELGKTKSQYFHLALGLTQNCTLSCVYCHADAGQSIVMDYEILYASAMYAKEKVIADKLKGINLSFAVGGEPTYDFELLKTAIQSFKDVANECGVECKTSMTTNGYYDQAIAEYLGKNIDNVLLSIDGIADVQNLHRPTRINTASFNKVINTADAIYSIKGDVSIRSTISNKNVSRLREFIDFLASKYSGAVTLVVEPLVPLGRGAKCKIYGVEPPDHLQFAQSFWDAYCYGETRGVRVRTSALNADRLVSGFCGAMFIPSFTVTTAGVITTCERDSSGENYGYGNYDKKNHRFFLDQEKIKINQQRTIIPSSCDDCICRYHCAGDCPDVKTIHYNRCKINKYLLKKYLLKRMIERRPIHEN